MSEPTIDDLFRQVFELDGKDRVAFLEILAPAIRSELETLLQFDQMADDERYLEGTEQLQPRSGVVLPEHFQLEAVPPDQDAFVVNEGTVISGEHLHESTAGDNDGIPWRVGDYLILREVGRGGMGVVYEAQHETLRRRVALKVLPPRASTNRSIDRFRREARSAGRLHHTNIVPVFEIACDETLHFYAMQFIEGRDLNTVINESRAGKQAIYPTVDGDQTLPNVLPTVITQHFTVSEDEPAEASEVSSDSGRDSLDSTIEIADEKDYFNRVASLGEQICDALAYAHGQGVMHRDIKPANLIMDSDSTVWITDFGLAKGDGEDLTNTGDVVGTIRYMAPERFQGKSDARSDLFSVGLTLYELCTLRPAYPQTDRLELIDAIKSSSLTPIRKLNPSVPRDLETIISKLLERDPAGRYQTGSDVVEDLRLFRADRPINARRANLLERVWRASRRNPMLASLVCCVCVLAVLVVAGSISYGMRIEQQSRKLSDRTKRALSAERNAVQARVRQTEKAYQALVSLARVFSSSEKPGRHFSAMHALGQAGTLLRELDLESEELEQRRRILRSEVIASLSLVDLRLRTERRNDPGWNGRDAIAPDFHRRADTDRKGGIRVIEGESELWSIRKSQRVDSIAFGPAGEFLVAIVNGAMEQGLVVWEAVGGKEVLRLEDVTWNGAPWAISGSGQIAVGLDGRVRIFSLESGKLQFKRKFPLGVPQRVGAMAFANNDRDLVVAAGKQLSVWSLADDSVKKTMELENTLTALTIAGESAIVGDQKGRIRQWRVDQLDSSPRALGSHTALVNALHASPNGVIASSAWDDTFRFWSLATGQQLLRVDRADLIAKSGHSERRFQRPGFSSDGSLVAMAGRQSRTSVFEIAQSPAKRSLWNPNRTKGKQSVQLVLWHPSEPLLLVTTDQGLEIWHPESERLLQLVPCETVKSAVFLDDGQSLLTAGKSGVQKWNVTLKNNGHDSSLEFGEPTVLFRSNVDRMTVNVEQSLAVVARGNSAILLPLDGSSSPAKIGEVRELDRLALSPDGKWLFTGTWAQTGIGIFDIPRRKFIKTLARNSGHANLAVSPDGKYLVASMKNRQQQVWEIGTWEEVKTLARPVLDGWPGVVHFSPGGGLLTIASSRNAARVLETATFNELFVLPSELRQTVTSVAFNANATQLAVGLMKDVEVWDLEEVQKQLETLGLQWEHRVPR
jgi:serine/threonine protein kinase/WD40 repeat protein